MTNSIRALQASSRDLTLGKGVLFFDPFVSTTNETYTGEIDLVECSEFNLSIATEILEYFSSRSGIRNKVDSVLQEINRTGNITCNSISAYNLSLFIVGTQSTVTQTATPVADEQVTVKQGRWYKLGALTANPVGIKGAGSVVVAAATSGASPYTITDDYLLNDDSDSVYIVPGGGIADDSAIYFNYTPTANSRTRISAATLAGLTGGLRYITDNPKGPNREYYFPKTEIRPTGDLALIGEEWMGLGFEVEVLTKGNLAQMYVDGVPA